MIFSQSKLLSSCKPAVCVATLLFNSTRALSRCRSVQGGSVEINGRKLCYVTKGTGPNVVLCLPGALGSAWTDFKPQLEQLDPKKFSLVAWDPPGYGLSRPPERDFSDGFFHRDAEMAVELMKKLAVPKFSMLGWSDGGITALLIAKRFPQHVQKCVVWGANAYVTKEDVEIYEKIRDINSWSEKMRAPMVSLYGEQYFRELWNKWVDTFVEIYNCGGDICMNEVRQITCPVLIIHGAKDPMIASDHPKFLASRIFSSRLHIFPTGKHNLHLQHAEEFNKIVSDFLLTQGQVGSYGKPLGSPL